MPEEKYCAIHKNVPTRLSCVSCGESICPKCMVSAAVGYKCPKCAKAKIHLQEISPKDYAKGILAGIIIGSGVGYMWLELSKFGALICLAIAYCVGFSIAKAITASIGNKIGKKIQITAALITIVSMVYNPIFLILNSTINSLGFMLFALTITCTSCIIKILAIFIAVWASIRHFRF